MRWTVKHSKSGLKKKKTQNVGNDSKNEKERIPEMARLGRGEEKTQR